MSTDVKHIISKLLAESSQFNVNDVLVNAKNGHRSLFFIAYYSDFLLGNLDLSEFPKRILSDARSNQKESGVNTLCLAEGTVALELNGRMVQSPILLKPISSQINRVQQTVSFKEVEDAAFINPFVIGYFRSSFDLAFPIELQENPEMEAIRSFLKMQGLEINSTTYAIGNFHHHRYQVLKELEELLEIEQLNPAIGTLFGEGAYTLPSLDLSSTALFPTDTDQQAVFDLVSNSHAVIQGPPGTGKSQVICNLVGKALFAKQTILAVSEKRAALEVIQSKLSHFGLDNLSFIAGSTRQSQDFLVSLKSTWDFFETYEPSSEINLQLSAQYNDHLQMTLDLLNQPDLIGGISFHEFQAISSGKNLGTHFSSNAPAISRFIEHTSITQRIYALSIQHVLSHFRKRTIESDDFLQFDQRTARWKEELRSLQADFTIETWADLSLAMKEAAVCQVFENDLFKQYSAIFTPESKEQKQFERLSKQYEALSDAKAIGSEWKIYPSLIETKSLQQQIMKGGFFERRSLKKRWKELSNLPISEAELILKTRIKAAQQEEKLNKCLSQLKKLGIHEPSTEILLIQNGASQFSVNQWESYLSIPVERRTSITKHHSELNHLYHDLQSAFHLDASTPLFELIDEINKQFSTILAERKQLILLNENELKSLRSCPTFEEYKALILHSNYTIFKERFPAFSNFQVSELKEKVSAILEAESSEALVHASQLKSAVHSRFAAFHLLLNTPASKLKPDQKLLKKELRKGKSILVKEFSKTRSHPSLRELFLSEARHWISLLKPIWLSNPSSLANCFPMDEHCFDLVIFDEASQIPIQHALGAIQRSKRIVVAGDEHQMGPSNFFQAGSSEVMDLLHQASYYYPKAPLLHHYRSVHPALIAFSNKHFYEGKLSAYPSANNSDYPIRHHFIEHALFQDRINLKEARAIAAHVSDRLNQAQSIGVVAFSEEQLSCIWKQLNAEMQEKLLLHQETNGGFFKALENVQGDECDCLIIGFGYGPNENGDFHLRFGPMNTENGRKRLNVLLTRARKSIDFFCSVRASDFKLSENESINLLRQWIAFSEKTIETPEVSFPHELIPAIDGNTATFDRIQSVLPKAKEIATLQYVLENRGWNVAYS